ncbi:hypothetical protein T03_5427 [Trichinella britovi]|uniref:Uncharacterized protein n=1 Tax=Trichinella britovi TaxID=45882 RepID=A0A0V1CRS7_TRIBR|nr:hypothetical protein T03_5427 [Trichinella britovi]
MQTQRKIFRYLVTCILSKKGKLDLERSHLLASIMLEILLVFSKKNQIRSINLCRNIKSNAESRSFTYFEGFTMHYENNY